MKKAAAMPAPEVPGIAPALPVARDQLDIVNRLHLVASSMPPRYPVTILAGELLALLNGFWQESRRADQAEARLAAKLEGPSVASPASIN